MVEPDSLGAAFHNMMLGRLCAGQSLSYKGNASGVL